MSLDQRVELALNKLGIFGPKELALWRVSPQGLTESLLSEDPSLKDVIDAPVVGNMCELAAELLDACTWLRVFDARPSASAEPEEDQQSLEELVAEGWKLSPDEDSHIGRRVKVRVEDEDSDVEGVVIAYLPPDDDEPMALWKIELTDGRRQDLELHELQDTLVE